MSIELEITRIRNARNKIRAKLHTLGLSGTTENIEELAVDVESIVNNGAVSVKVQEGDTYAIPRGFHNGSGTVSAVAGGGHYELQSKIVTPAKSEQAITPDQGFYGLSDITVKAIPESYQDVSSVTATAADVMANKIIVDKAGKLVAGTMPNNGAASKTLDAENTEQKIAQGYHSGLGTVKVVIETKTATPTKLQQAITPTPGKLLSQVVVQAIPPEFVETGDATAVAGHILVGDTAYVGGTKVTGTMPNNKTLTGTIDGLVETSYTIPAGYTAGGTVKLTGDIEAALAAI